MTQYEKDLSNLSYTNKDFGQIYPELLDLVKKISYKWDPSQSDESDPGVILLKLAALMADKNNYNIDKNILETFPLSVTQLPNARQLFEQCGYSMKYYQSATTTVSMVLPKGCEPDYDNGFPESVLSKLSPYDINIDVDDPAYVRSYVIPRFTMISDVENSVVYTTTQDVILQSDGITVDNIPVIQGVINTYTINGESTITASNLDYNNRLYFTEVDIPENGVFITSNIYPQWKKVDNLVLQPTGTPCYKFGVTQDGSMCYVEFPSDIDTLIGNGIEIRYLRTQGYEGNIGKGGLCQLFSDLSTIRYIDPLNTQDVILTTYESFGQGNIYITNEKAATNGQNPETIDEAYRNYQKIKTTFETLVSLTDYENFLFTNENVSNCFVCDRTNDIQSSYKILNSDGTSTKTVTCVHKNTDDVVELTPFDLKVYGLSYIDNPLTDDGFNRSFKIIDHKADTATEWIEILSDTEYVKSIQHNYKEFEANRIIMLMNHFPIIARIIPQYKLDLRQTNEVQTNIKNALYKALNSRMIDFGSEIDYELIYDTITGADPRIKAITLDTIEYATYAYFKDETGKINKLRIDTLSKKPDNANLAQLWVKFRKEIYTKSVLAGKTQLFNPVDEFSYGIGHRNSNLVSEAYSMTTNVDIVCESQKDSTDKVIIYESEYLKENENVVFTAPNFIDDVPYSSYVKFLHNIKLNGKDRPSHSSNDLPTIIKANEEYTLGTDEYIVFFWKEEDDESAPYQYIKYSGNYTDKDGNVGIKIISPSFSMRTQCQPAIGSIPETTLENLKPGERGTTDYIGDVTVEDKTMSFTRYVSDLMDSDYVLTGSNTIKTKKPNTIHINNVKNGTSHIFWMLNNTTEDNRCILFEPNQTEYILKSGEYFLYSNELRTQIHTLGAGTKITRDLSSSGISWTCAAVNYDEYIFNEIEFLEDKWFKIPEGYNVYATEMKYYQIGPDHKITLKPLSQDSSTLSSITFNNESSEVQNFEISYSDNKGSITTLPVRTDVGTCWSAYSLLNFKSSSTTPQIIRKNHSISFYDEEGNAILTFSGNDNSIEDVDGKSPTDVRLLTTRPISLTGGSNISCITFDITGEIIPLEVYVYELNPDSKEESGSEWKFTESEATLTLPTTETSNSSKLTFKLPLGNYILPITTTEDLDTLRIYLKKDKDGSVLLKTLSNQENYSKAGTHYLSVSFDNNQEQELEIVTSTSNELVELKFGKLLRYEVPNFIVVNDDEPEYKINSDDFNEQDIAKMIDTQLDIDHLFNYTYVVPPEDLVRNPLVASSFVDSNHIFNPYTICRWDTSESRNKLTIVNKIK